MELNSKKLEQTSRIVYYSISTLLCLFLILLSGKIIGDLDSTAAQPSMEDFENRKTLDALDNELDSLRNVLGNLNSQKMTIEKTIGAARENYANEKQSFDNWLQTRKTLGTPDKDEEVIARANKLDEFYKVEQAWRNQLGDVQNLIDRTENAILKVTESIVAEDTETEKRYSVALQRYELKVFLIRLLFVGPVLALGIFFFVRFRRHKFWPLYFGFSLFSLYAFFFGLVPYLPSYGGYVRYSVGVALSAGLGYYAIRRIRQYVEQKRAELNISTQERAKKVQTDAAEKALEGHFCPSCGKDFILKKWEFPMSKGAEADAYKFVTSFCRHCGLELFRNCNNCGTKNFAHLMFCSSCGTKVSDGK